jgi:hypothetical protein
MAGAFAVGVFGGVIGCILLLLRMPAAKTVIGISLAASIIFYIGDSTHGVFAAFGLSHNDIKYIPCLSWLVLSASITPRS